MKKNVLYVLILLLSTNTNAQQNLTVKDAVEIALKNSLGIRIARNNISIADINNSYGMAGGLPFVNAIASDEGQLTSVRDTYSNSTNNIVNNNAGSNTISAALNGSVLLYNGNRVVTAKKRLGVTESQTEQQFGSRALLIVYNVLLKYYDIIRQQSYAKTLEISIDVSKQKLEIVKKQLSVGLANNADLFQSQVDLNTQIQNLQAQQLIIDQDKTDLLTLLTLRPDSAITVIDTILVDKKVRLDSVLNGIVQNPDIIAANQQVSINQFIQKEISAQRYPALSFGAGYNYAQVNNGSGFSVYTALLNRSNGPYAALNLNIPIFNGNIYRKQQQIADINIKSATLQKDTLVLAYTANAVKSWEAYTNNLQQLETAKENYDLSLKLLDLVTQRFQLRQATIVDIKNAQQSFENAGYLLVNISYAAKSAEIQLKRYSNRLSY